MLINFIFLGFAFALPELIIIRKVTWLRELCEKNTLIELGFSLFVGYVIGYLMGVNGVYMAIGNVVATAITKAIYSWHLMDRWENAKLNISAGMQVMRYRREQIRRYMQVIRAVLNIFTYIPRQVQRLCGGR